MAHPFNYEGDNILSLSHSSLVGTYASCPRRFQLRKLMRLRQHEDNHAGNAGTAMHNAWYVSLRGGSREDAAWQLMRDYPIQYQKSPMETRSLEACYGSLMALLDSNMMMQFELAYIEHDGAQRPAIEVPFALHLQNQNGDPLFLDQQNRVMQLVYIGYIDAIVYDVLNDIYLVIDLKTTTKDLPDYTPMFQFDTQCMPYALVLERMLNRSIDNLSVMYGIVKIDHLLPRVLGLKFEKDMVDLQEWLRVLTMSIRDMQLFYTTNWWPKRQSACVGYGTCQFANSMCGSRNDDYIRSMFELEHSDPSANVRPPFEPWFQVDLQIQGLT